MSFILKNFKNIKMNELKPFSAISFTSKKRNGFTLIEMIVVLAILGILLTIATPSLQYYAKKTEDTSSNSTTKAIYSVVVNKMVDSTGTDVTQLLNFTNTPDLFSLQNLKENDVHFVFTDNTKDTYSGIDSIVTANPDKFIVLVPVVNTKDNVPDFTQDIYIIQPNSNTTFINGQMY